MPISDVSLGISDGGTGGAGGGAGGAPGFVTPPVTPQGSLTLLGPAGQTVISPDADGNPGYAINGGPPIPLGPFNAPRVDRAGILTVGGVQISGLLSRKRGDLITRAGTWPNISAWPDSSGLGNNETATGTPTWLANAINNRAGVLTPPGSYFSSSGSNLFADRGPRTIFVVCKSTNGVGGRLFVSRLSGQVYICEFIVSGGNTLVYGDGVAVNDQIIDSPAFNGIPMILEFSFDGNTGVGGDAAPRLRINGVDHGVTVGLGAETGPAGWSTGSLISDQAFNWPGPICEMTIFGKTLSPLESEAFYGYASPYYRIGCTLPTQVMALGDSTTAGAGDSFTTSDGGWRKSVSDRHQNLQFIGSIYSPHSTPGDGSGKWNRSEGHSGFTSGPIVFPTAGYGIGGPQLAGYIGATGTVPKLIIKQIGQNDAGLGVYTASQTAQNISDNLDDIYALSPSTKVIVIAANRMRSNNTAANAVILAQRTTVANAIADKPNVLGPLEIPPNQGDEVYIDDNHFNRFGYAGNATMIHAALVARGY